jgi:hypothetical protein
VKWQNAYLINTRPRVQTPVPPKKKKKKKKKKKRTKKKEVEFF